MGSDQEGAIDPSQHHIEEGDHDPAGMEAMAILIRNLTRGQKGISKPTTTTGVAGATEICDIATSPPAPYYSRNHSPQEFSLTLVAGHSDGRQWWSIAQDFAEWASGHIRHLNPQQRGDGWSNIQVGDLISRTPGRIPLPHARKIACICESVLRYPWVPPCDASLPPSEEPLGRGYPGFAAISRSGA